MKLFLPDCLWTPSQLSGAGFLYFHDQPIAFTLHPSVSSFLTGVDTFTFLPYLESRRPAWGDAFYKFFDLWRTFRASLTATHELIEPLRKNSFRTILLSYNRGEAGWESAGEILAASSLEKGQIASLIDPYHASDELFAHIFFEKVLECRYPGKSQEFFVQLGKQQTPSLQDPSQLIKDFDWSQVYDYCENLFADKSLSDLLTRAYMFRMPMLRDSMEILLSNQQLIPFLASLPVERPGTKKNREGTATDVIAWEFFRQLVSPYVDPLDKSKVKLVRNMLAKRQNEVARLKNKCYALAEEIGDEKDLEELITHVRDHIKAQVLNDLEDLLKLDKKAFSKFVADLFSDEKSWIAVSTFLYGLLNGEQVLTAGASIYALSNLGAKAFKEAAKVARD